MDVGAVKDISGAAGVDHAIGWHGERPLGPDFARFVVPDEAALAERHAADPAAAPLEIV